MEEYLDSRPLDRYLRYLADQSGLADERRSDVFESLRRRNEEIVSERVAKGTPPDLAERETLSKLGPPRTAINRLNLFPRDYWRWFQIGSLLFFISMAVAILAIFFHGLGTPAPFYSLLFLITTPIAVLFAWISFNRIKVSGGQIDSRRTTKPWDSIELADIEKLEFQKGHLLGRRGVDLVSSKRRVTIHPCQRGFYSVGLLLTHLHRGRIDPKIESHLTNIRPRVKKERKERRVFYYLLLTLWAAIALSILWAFPGLWRFEVAPIWIPIPILLALFLSQAQEGFHRHPCNRGICHIAAGLLIIDELLFAAFLIGAVEFFRWLLILFAAACCLPILALVWRGTKTSLLSSCFVLLSLAGLSYFIIPPVWEGEIHSWRETEILSPIKWMAGPPQRLALIYEETLLVMEDGKEVDSQELGEGRWDFLSDYSEDTLTLTMSDLRNGEIINAVALYPLFGDLKILGESNSLRLGGFALFGTQVWSPDREYLLTQFTEKVDEEKSKTTFAISEPDTGRLQPFEVFERGSQPYIGGWVSPTELQCLEIHSTSEENRSATAESVIKVWLLNAETGDATRMASHLIETGHYKYPPGGMKYHLLSTGAPSEFSEREVNLGFLDLVTGDRRFLPDPVLGNDSGYSLMAPFSWSRPTQRLVYNALLAGKPAVVVATPEGVVDRLEVDPKYNIGALRISPDGQKVFFLRRRKGDWTSARITQVCVWDLNRGQTTVVRKLGWLESLVSLFMESDNGFFLGGIVWSPDSRRIAITTMELKWRVDGMCHIIEYEDWAEKNLLNKASGGS